jgi:hypothetical protein
VHLFLEKLKIAANPIHEKSKNALISEIYGLVSGLLSEVAKSPKPKEKEWQSAYSMR